MRLWKTTWTDCDDGHRTEWARNQREANRVKARIRQDMPERLCSEILVESVEVPTSKADLVNWLNRETA